MKGLFLSVSLITIQIGFSQSRVDSLRNLIDLTDSPERKIDVLNNLAFELYDYNLDDALQTADQALKQSKRVNYKKGEGWATIHHGMYYLLSGNPSLAKENYKKAKTIADEIADADLKSYSLLQYGKAHRDVGYFDSAQLYYEQAEAIQLKQTNPNKYNLSRIYSALSRNYLIQENPKQALVYGQKGFEVASNLKEKEWVGYAWIDIGDAYRNMYEFEKADECYVKAKDLYGSYSWVGVDVYESLGISQFLQGDLEKAFESFTIVMKAYDTYQGKQVFARALIRMGEILEVKGLYDIAQEYLVRGLKISEASGYYYLTGESYLQLAWVSYGANQLQSAEADVIKAQEYFSRVNNTSKLSDCFNSLGLIKMKGKLFDSALDYHRKALSIREELGNQTKLSATLFNIGELYLRQRNLEEAGNYFLHGSKIDERIKDKYGLAMYYDRLGRISMYQEKLADAESYLKMALELANKSTSLDILGTVYDDYSLLLERKGDWKEALRYRKLFEHNYDSSYSRGTAQSLTSYRTLYDLAAKDRQIELLSKDRQIQEETIRKRNLIIYWSVAFGLVLIVAVYILYHYSRRQKKSNIDLSEKNEEIQTQSEELQEANHALVRLNDEVNRNKEEIKNQAEELMVSHEAIARINQGLEKIVEQRTSDLRKAYQELDTFFYRSSHDFRRPLTTLMGLCEVAKLSVQDKSALDLFQKVNVTAANLDKMLMKLQSISDVGSHQLVHKEVLLEQIIDNEIDNRKDAIESKQILVSVNVDLKGPFISYPVLVKIIVENLIENAIDFSTPHHPKLVVSAVNQNGSVLIEVQDNGEGIKDEIRPRIFEMFFRGTVRSVGNGLGLYIARKAAEKASGKISFKSNPEGGTTFTVEIPNNKTL